MYKYSTLYPGAFRGNPNFDPSKPLHSDTSEVIKYDVRACLEEMKEAAVDLEEAKETFKEACTLAYARFTQDIAFGDPDPPSQKALTKLAQAMAKDEVSKFSKELRDLSNALIQGTHETPTLFNI